ncbi:MAG: SGNH/GDSL hydrolase family protein [Myxococcales bacterium]|nr:MAG: SGNH/GDSL hydrolase family protein [Myxococcales bacterium]
MTTTASGKSFGKRVLHLFVWVAIALVACEIFYRFAWTEPPKTELIADNHPVFHHVPPAFLKGGLGEYDFRGAKYGEKKKPGAVRVVFMGDSFTYGFTASDQTIPAHFKRLAITEFPDRSIEVLNFGYKSYAPLLHAVVYRRLVKQLDADYVLMLYDTFDSQEDSLYARLATFDQNGDPVAVVGEHFQNTGLKHSALVRFLLFATEVVRNHWGYLPYELRIANRLTYLSNPDRFAAQVNYSFQTVERLADKITEDGSRFVLYHYPPVFMLRDTHEFAGYFATIWGLYAPWQAPGKSPFGQKLLAFCAETELDCHDFTPEVLTMEEELGAGGSRLAIYNNEDAHFTGDANARFARFILDTLKEEGFPHPAKTAEPAP